MLPVLVLFAWPAWFFTQADPVVPARAELEEHTGVVTESSELDGGRYNPRSGVRLRVMTDLGVVAGEATGWQPADPPAVGDTVSMLVTRGGSMRRIWEVSRNGRVVLPYERARRAALQRRARPGVRGAGLRPSVDADGLHHARRARPEGRRRVSGRPRGTEASDAPAAALDDLRRALRERADPAAAAVLRGFFKTGPGEYGEGDRFLGVRVPHLRRLAKDHRGVSMPEALELLRSPWHEERLAALLLLVGRYRRGGAEEREAIHRAYLGHTAYVNNWDLVDLSAEHLVGAHLDPERLGPLERLAAAESVWERRIAILATFGWIKRGTFGPTLRVAGLLLHDRHDLVHKAVGWMLREVGKRDRAAEEEFLRAHHVTMPRTMLRYAIERFPPELRRRYLRGEA